MDIRTAFAAICIVPFLMTMTRAHQQQSGQDSRREEFGGRFADFLVRASRETDVTARRVAAKDFADRAARIGRAMTTDSTVTLFYFGEARSVTVPSDLNGWDPSADSMVQLAGTPLFFLTKAVDRGARFEYKFVVDSTWILDPFNARQATGGYGPNSEVWMPSYRPPTDIERRDGIPRGSIDTLRHTVRSLRRALALFVYVPPGYQKAGRRYPVLYVLDGGEYLSLALMKTTLDNLIAEKAIPPILGVFVDPRTDVNDSRTSMRMKDYAMSDTFLTALAGELRPWLLTRYRMRREPAQTGIMGASLGGLFATYAAFTRPDVFGLCAAQSPAYQWNNSAIIGVLERSPKKSIRIYLDTGTIRDAQKQAREVRDILMKNRYTLRYEEHPEGHNWANWRARVGSILRFFWGKQ